MSAAQEKSTWVGFTAGMPKLGKITLIFGRTVLAHDRWVHGEPEPYPQGTLTLTLPQPRGSQPLTAALGARPAPSPSSHSRTAPQSPCRPCRPSRPPARGAQHPAFPATPPPQAFRKQKRNSAREAGRGALRDA